MTTAFGIEDISVDDLIATALEDPKAIAGETKAFQGLDFGELHAVYKQFCKNENVENSPVRLGEVIAYYNQSVANLPDHTTLKGTSLPGLSLILDGQGQRFTEVYEEDGRRIFTRLADIPDHVRKAFVAAEDKRFLQHRGIDERGIIRAFVGNFAASGRPQGGSTITQQVAKNLLVGDDVTYDRKMREMIVASRLERTLSKDELLEIYLNYVFLGRASWGVEMAARSYFGKSAKALSLTEGAFLAALTKGPGYYNPDRFPERVAERVAYVLNRMQEDGYISADEMKRAVAEKPELVPFISPRSRGGFHLVDQVGRDAKTLAGIPGLTKSTYTVRSTVHPKLQGATEAALQEGLARYELNAGRFTFSGAELNLAEAVRRIEAAPAKAAGAAAPKPAWLQALEAARLPLYDVHWDAAVVLDKGRARSGDRASAGRTVETVRVGLKDGRVVPLRAGSAAQRAKLQPFDVLHVKVTEGARGAAVAELRSRPQVQGAALVLENRTGRILSMAGSFSYPLSQLNRATQAERQPGSAIKPVTFLAALGAGLQPNTLVWDTPITLPPVGGWKRGAKAWSPKNYDARSSGLITIRQGLEHSKNLVTARLLDGGIASEPESSLRALCDLAKQAGLYDACVPHYPFILGAQPVRLVDLAAFYAAIANEGFRPSPYVLESIEQNGRSVYRRNPTPPTQIGAVDRVAFHQMKSLLQGVLQRGTARSLRDLSPYVGGKTGTTDGENDAWFVGFTNEVTIAVWVGYDNAAGKRRTLGGGFTGGKIALPIFEDIVQAAWRDYAPRTALAPPSREVASQIAAVPIDLRTGDRLEGYDRAAGQTAFVEQLRRSGPGGSVDDTQFSLVPRERAYAYLRPPVDDFDERTFENDPSDSDSRDFFGRSPYGRDVYGRAIPRGDPFSRYPYDRDPRDDQPYGQRYAQPPMVDDSDRATRRPRRIDPDYFWRQIY
jgi:membrane carboxypeptidase/penicillin-binding protein